MDSETPKFMIPLEDQLPANPERKSKLIDLEDVGKILAKQRVFGISGSHSVDGAMALIRAAIRHGARDMTLVPPTTCSIAGDIWMAAGVMKKLYLSYLGFEYLGMAPNFRRCAVEGSVEIVEADEPFIQLGTRAAAGGRPFNVIQHVWEATDHPKLNPEIKTVTDPFTGDTVYAIPPLHLDVAVIHAQAADQFGNAQCWGGNRQEPDKCKAAKLVIVQADEIVGPDVIEGHAAQTTVPGTLVDHVVHVPFGAHPTFSSGNYAVDEDHLRLYLKMCGGGDHAEYIEKYVMAPRDHYEYLDLVGGMKRMHELRRQLAV
jgi:glutaconate CoA-transferase subunit A